MTIIIITIIYLFWIVSLAIGCSRLPKIDLNGLKSQTRFSIIVPFRNEETHLPALLESISRLTYPEDHFEIIFVNDASEDNSLEIVHSFLATLGITPTDLNVIENIRASNSPKKDAITLAVAQAKYDWIVTTDADGVLPRYWLECFDELIQKEQPNCIAGPISYSTSTGFLQQFQKLEHLSLQGATMGGFGLKKPFLCNGANLAYKKQLFETVNGFEGNTDIASGDDIFLLEKALKINPEKVRYLKCEAAVVSSSPPVTMADLIAQRVRWAAKTSASKNLFGTLTGLVVLAQNVLVLVCFVLMIIGSLSFWGTLFVFFAKLIADYMLISTSARFFNEKSGFWQYLLSGILYPLFTVYIVIITLFSEYEWKGRRYKK